MKLTVFTRIIKQYINQIFFVHLLKSIQEETSNCAIIFYEAEVKRPALLIFLTKQRRVIQVPKYS